MTKKEQIYKAVQHILSAPKSKNRDGYNMDCSGKSYIFSDYYYLIEKHPEAFAVFGIRGFKGSIYRADGRVFYS